MNREAEVVVLEAIEAFEEASPYCATDGAIVFGSAVNGYWNTQSSDLDLVLLVQEESDPIRIKLNIPSGRRADIFVYDVNTLLGSLISSANSLDHVWLHAISAGEAYPRESESAKNLISAARLISGKVDNRPLAEQLWRRASTLSNDLAANESVSEKLLLVVELIEVAVRFAACLAGGSGFTGKHASRLITMRLGARASLLFDAIQDANKGRWQPLWLWVDAHAKLAKICHPANVKVKVHTPYRVCIKEWIKRSTKTEVALGSSPGCHGGLEFEAIPLDL
ncbi:MAG: hypothetical protein ACK4F7_01170 [Inhella sp.]